MLDSIDIERGNRTERNVVGKPEGLAHFPFFNEAIDGVNHENRSINTLFEATVGFFLRQTLSSTQVSKVVQ